MIMNYVLAQYLKCKLVAHSFDDYEEENDVKHYGRRYRASSYQPQQEPSSTVLWNFGGVIGVYHNENTFCNK